MQKNQKGFSVIEAMLILVVVALIGGVGLYVWQSNKPTAKSQDSSKTPKTSKSTQTSATTINPTIDAMLKGVDYQLLDSTPGSACSDNRNVCYSGETVFLKMKYPVPDALKMVAANLTQNKWLLDDGKPADSFLKSDTIVTSDSNPNNTPDKDLLFKEPGAEKNYGYYGYFNLGLFGGHETIYNGDQGAYFFAFSKSEVQTNDSPYYLLQSNLSVDNSYDFGKLLSKLDDGSFILSVTLGKKTP